MKDDVDPQVKHFHISRVSRSVGACAERGDVATVRSVHELDDGAYNVVVMEADDIGEDTLALSLLVTSGHRRGEIICIRAHRWGVTWIDALGAAATLTIAGGRPHLALG